MILGDAAGLEFALLLICSVGLDMSAICSCIISNLEHIPDVDVYDCQIDVGRAPSGRRLV